MLTCCIPSDWLCADFWYKLVCSWTQLRFYVRVAWPLTFFQFLLHTSCHSWHTEPCIHILLQDVCRRIFNCIVIPTKWIYFSIHLETVSRVETETPRPRLHPCKSCILLYWQHYCTALDQWASAKLCGVVHKNGITELSQRAPPIFGWTAITLGISPHSSLVLDFSHRLFLLWPIIV